MGRRFARPKPHQTRATPWTNRTGSPAPMAIYHFSAKMISRSTGRSAVAAAAYRTAERIEDHRQGLEHDYSNRSGVLHTEILAPDGTPEALRDRATLWNAVEQVERRKDAQLAREVTVALPHELTDAQRASLVRSFVQSAFVDRGMIADVALHSPGREGDERNHHAHIMLTTRKAVLHGNDIKLTDKADIELSNAKRSKLGLGTTQEDIKAVRQMWAEVANNALERAGQRQKIDHRSYADQNSQLQPTIHEGNAVTQLRRQGIETEISRYNDRVKQSNTKGIEQEQARNTDVLDTGLTRANNRLEQWQKNQEAKRQEKERLEQLKRQQELEKQRAEQASRQSSRSSSKGGWSR